MKNKIFSLILAVAFILTAVSSMAICAYASSPQFTVKTVSTTEDTVTVVVGIKGNTSQDDLKIGIQSSGLEYESSEGVGITGNTVYYPNSSYNTLTAGDTVSGNGDLCKVTFKKSSDGKNATIKIVDGNGTGEIKDSDDLQIQFKAPTTTKKPVTTTKKPVTTTKKATTTKKPTTVKATKPAATQLLSPTLPGVTISSETTTEKESTTEEMTTEEVTEEVTEEYESYSYVASANTEEDENEDKSDNVKKIILIVVVVVCAAAAAGIYVTKRR